MKNGAQSRTKDGKTTRPDSKHKILIWVQCEGYRCLAYMDAAGKWINFYTGEKLMDFVKVIG